MPSISIPAPEPEVEDEQKEEAAPLVQPDEGTVEWIHWWSATEASLQSPINITITNAIVYKCPPIVWYNFDIYPHKMKLTNTGYTVILCAKWTTERPYIMGGPFMANKKYIFSQLHFHWGAHVMEGSEHTVDGRTHPMEMHVVYFNSVYLTQEEAFNHNDGVVIMCYLIRYHVEADERINIIQDLFPYIKEAKTCTRVGPVPLSRLFPMFVNDYFVYWGSVSHTTANKVAMFLVPRMPMSACEHQIERFRRLLDPWDEPNRRNFASVKDAEGRHVFFVNPEWSMHNSLLPIPRLPIPSISQPSPAYLKYPSMIPELNTDLRGKISLETIKVPDE